MSLREPVLEISPSPYVRSVLSTPRLMLEVLGALVPVVALSAWYFGVSALLVVFAAAVGAAITERLVSDGVGLGTLRDGSGVLTGVLLGLTLPPAVPLWMAFLGGAVAIALGKLVWGGLGRNVFNPALLGRAFLQSAFPAALTTWTAPGAGFWRLEPSTLAPPFFKPAVDLVSAATPLGLSKFEHQLTGAMPLLTGNVAGSIGETSALLLVLIGVWLGVRRIFDWRLCVATLAGAAVFSGILHLVNAQAYPSPVFMLLSGGLMFASVFMVTDPVTSPVTPRGAWIFGAGVGFLVVLIRLFGGLPEAVMYSVLLMNALVPILDRHTQPRRFGG